jgi:hypothetical protein
MSLLHEMRCLYSFLYFSCLYTCFNTFYALFYSFFTSLFITFMVTYFLCAVLQLPIILFYIFNALLYSFLFRRILILVNFGLSDLRYAYTYLNNNPNVKTYYYKLLQLHLIFVNLTFSKIQM